MKTLNLNKLCSFCSATVVALTISVTSMQSVAETLRLSTPVPPSHIFSKVSTKFAEDLSIRTNGDLNIKVFPFGKLGSDPENTLMIQTGAIQFAIIPAAFMANREESLNAWLLPGLFDDVAAAGAATQFSTAKGMLAELDKQGMVGLGYVFAGMRHLLSVDPISDMKEIKDKKIRTFPGLFLMIGG
ncbi:TRAP transporter substrate-binding protein [Marinomonas sp. RS-M-Aa-14]|uniref:TRAP transporter substrate-binding protein n=1 Tax=Marinomonas sp. RS-M-Aa-14 TaxID=3241169 RepID=UPI003AAE9672